MFVLLELANDPSFSRVSSEVAFCAKDGVKRGLYFF